MNARHDALLALASSVPWPVRALHNVPPGPAPAPTPAPADEPAIKDPPAPDQLPPVRDPPPSHAADARQV
ncbi:MAG TPA: hypothetical protein VFY73_19315 [Ideonella sp.]|uniref:hypothetical protein n=1 Tax=Ideonella sp. TaxID=1929293 RepID=UPI002E30697B|nr:hypothetical protein [Ideonella sp.]HEX5686183.1 hypothetical protein [Ideonella sp.]